MPEFPSLPPTRLFAAGVVVALLPLANVRAQPPAIAPAPIPGPVDLSIHQEVLEAMAAAQRWMENHDFLPPPMSPPSMELQPDQLPSILPLLDGQTNGLSDNLFQNAEALARLLQKQGQTTVFLPDGRPVIWREALLRQLVIRQKRDSQGGGFWRAPSTPSDDLPATLRDTLWAISAIRAATD